MELLTRCWTIIRRRWLILFSCFAAAVVGTAVYNISSDRNFTSSTEVFLRAPDVKTSAAAYQGDLFSRQRAQSYADAIRSDELAQMVIDKLALDIPPGQLASRVSATAVKNTVLMTVSVTDRDPQRATNIANEYADVLGTYIAKLENVSNDPNIPPLVQVVTKANSATSTRTGFPLWQVAIAATALALLVAAGLIYLLDHFDTKLRSRRQVEEITQSDILGRLPNVRELGFKGNVAKAFGDSEKFSQAALRLSLNVEATLRRLPDAEIPHAIAVIACQPDDRGTVVTLALAHALAKRGRTVGVVRFAAAGKQRSKASDSGAAGSASARDDNRTHSVTTVTYPTAGLTPEILSREIDVLRTSNDVILIDVPSFHESIDSQLAVGMADGALLVARPTATRTVSLANLVAGAKVLGTPVLGVVVNQARESSTVDGFYL